MRGTKSAKTVWIATQSCHHRNGWEERWIGGVYADRQTAIDECVAFNEIRGPLRVSDEWDDGDCYIYGAQDERLCIIQRHSVIVRTKVAA